MANRRRRKSNGMLHFLKKKKRFSGIIGMIDGTYKNSPTRKS